MKKLSLFLFVAFFAFSLNAEIWMPKLFSNNMVLQNGQDVKVWGTSSPNASVQVKFFGQKVSTKSNKDGEWSLFLKPMKVNAEPQVFEVFENGKLKKTINNVLVGEVWFICGQSNMQFGMSAANNYKEVNPNADYPQIRFFIQNPMDAIAATPQKEFQVPAHCNWEVVKPNKIGGLSAVGFFFAVKLNEDLNVPVGLIEAALGGASMITWIDRKDLDNVASHQRELKEFDKNNENYNYEEAKVKYEKDKIAYDKEKSNFEKDAKNEGKKFNKYPPRRPFKLAWNRPQRMPGYLYNAMINPAVGYTIKGVLWYQGEDDGYGPKVFEEKFTAIINGWRKYWKNENLPFIFVQLPSWGSNAPWADVRWSQYKTSQNVKNVHMAVCVDLGEKEDIHPRNKIDVGNRLEKIALKEVYKKDVKAYGPKFDKIIYDADSVSIKFNSFGQKIVQKGDLRGFEVLCGKKWLEAKDIKLDAKNNVVIVKSPNGEDVDAVRYLWKSWAAEDVCLFNEDGLPAMSFIDKNE